MSSADEHVKRTAESQRVLQAAREKARRKNIYDSAQTRHDLGHLARLFEAEFKKPAYEWQINVSEAIVLELEAVVIAGTGAEGQLITALELIVRLSRATIWRAYVTVDILVNPVLTPVTWSDHPRISRVPELALALPSHIFDWEPFDKFEPNFFDFSNEKTSSEYSNDDRLASGMEIGVNDVQSHPNNGDYCTSSVLIPSRAQLVRSATDSDDELDDPSTSLNCSLNDVEGN
ncbi:hypothetical protein GGX14DRAFT_395801 [Mycena pura]|uniref:Uncharacterized protein n=1 Tax=Mycena pura TaxID=153505 RepID=A0AAD6VD64_9AGAR|nr:hypothetical protein GGX14DRAFT_395801 [Mycena pura]